VDDATPADQAELSSTDGRRWAFLSVLRIPDIEHPEKLYLWRLRILATPWFGIHLHRIGTTDENRFPHDHPWPFFAITLWGGYLDEHDGIRTVHIPGRPHWHPATYTHAIRKLFRVPTWTLVITGRRVRDWGYWTDEGWVEHETYEEQYKKDREEWLLLERVQLDHYVSSYCCHGLIYSDPDDHRRCRLRCKDHAHPCRCPCHRDGRGKPIPDLAEAATP
jgi:hypothetical protein